MVVNLKCSSPSVHVNKIQFTNKKWKNLGTSPMRSGAHCAGADAAALELRMHNAIGQNATHPTEFCHHQFPLSHRQNKRKTRWRSQTHKHHT